MSFDIDTIQASIWKPQTKRLRLIWSLKTRKCAKSNLIPYLLYIRRHRLSVQDISQLSVCLSFLSFCLSFLSNCLFYLFVFSVSSLSVVQKWKSNFCFTLMNRAWPWRMSDLVYYEHHPLILDYLAQIFLSHLKHGLIFLNLIGIFRISFFRIIIANCLVCLSAAAMLFNKQSVIINYPFL